MNMKPSKLLVDQRIRNRIIEHLQNVLEFQRDPGVMDLNDLANDWDMYVTHPIGPQTHPPPAFTAEELEEVKRVNAAWDAFCQCTPPVIKHERASFELPQWRALMAACEVARHVFLARGRLSEEVEIH